MHVLGGGGDKRVRRKDRKKQGVLGIKKKERTCCYKRRYTTRDVIQHRNGSVPFLHPPAFNCVTQPKRSFAGVSNKQEFLMKFPKTENIRLLNQTDWTLGKRLIGQELNREGGGI